MTRREKSAAGFSVIRFAQYAKDLSRAVSELGREYRMGLKLQGIAAKVAKLEHDAEFEASKLDAKIEEVAARMPGVFSGAHGSVDKLAQNVGDIEGAFSAIQSVTNGAPAEAATDERAAPAPYPTYP